MSVSTGYLTRPGARGSTPTRPSVKDLLASGQVRFSTGSVRNTDARPPADTAPDTTAALEYIRAGLALIPFPRGLKGPKGKDSTGWNLEENAIRTQEQASKLNGVNLGLAHRWCGTCAVDVDDDRLAGPWLTERGVNLQALLDAPDAVQISSGRPNRSKLIYRLPSGIPWLESHMITVGDATALELRCAYAEGLKTAQDVLPPSVHPKTDQPYVWAGAGDFHRLPELPGVLLKLWCEQDVRAVPPPQRDRGPVDLPRLKSALATIPPTVDRDTWIRVGMGLKTDVGDDGFELFDAWSRGPGETACEKYDEEGTRKAWDGFKRTGDDGKPVVRVDSIHHVARAHGWVDPGQGEVATGAARTHPVIPPLEELGISYAEYNTAELTPRCIVEDLFYEDVALRPGPGGTGKTTLALYEALHVVYGWPLYGLPVRAPGPVVIITAEDRRGLLIARLRELMTALAWERVMARCDASGYVEEDAEGWNPDDIASYTYTCPIMDQIKIWDVTGGFCRLAELDKRGNLAPTGLVDAIVERFKGVSPSMVILDPVISFGAGERLVNDNEQALIEAARRIVRGLGCCVVLITHTGKQNARDGVIDQYAARGGSALSDGSRMTHVLRSWDPEVKEKDERLNNPPEGFLPLGDGEQAMILARPKGSHTAEYKRPYIWIKRRGWSFKHFTAVKLDRDTVKQGQAASDADKLFQWLVGQLGAGRRYSKNMLEAAGAGLMPQRKLRAALGALMSTGRVLMKHLPKEECSGGFREYLHPEEVPF